MWLTLYLINNCFNDKSKTHLGLKFKGNWYAITHLDNNKGSKIPKKYLQMKEISSNPEFLKKVNNSAPNIVQHTSMKIHEKVLLNYDKFKLDNLENKQKRYSNEQQFKNQSRHFSTIQGFKKGKERVHN